MHVTAAVDLLWRHAVPSLPPLILWMLGGGQGLLRYGVRPSRTYSFGDQLGLVRGMKPKIEDGSDLGTHHTQVTSVGDLGGAQRLRLQLVPGISQAFAAQRSADSIMSSAHPRRLYCLTLSSTGVGPLKRIAQNRDARALLACRTMPPAR